MRPALPIAVALLLAACGDSLKTEADRFLLSYETQYQPLYYTASQAEWASNTHIVEGDSTNAVRTKAANKALLAFTGSSDNIAIIRKYLAQKAKLTPMQVRRLEKMLYNAAQGPQTVADVVAERIASDAEQTEKLYGFKFTIGGKEVSPNDIDKTLRESTNLAQRRAAWESSKEVGKVLKPGIVKLRDLRNKTVEALDYPDFFAYQVSDYGMKPEEMLVLSDKLIMQLRPLYRELHTWARYELAKRYKAPVPDLIPADWLPNRWGQDWSALVTVEGLNVDSALKQHTPEGVVKQGEAFYMSLGFDSLPKTFWERSSLYPVAANSPFKKNTHASAWHLDLDKDVRSLMSVENNAWWYETAHHELGHIYYFQTYSRPEVPLVLREGANRAYHEAIGSMIGFAASQPLFLQHRGLAPTGAKTDGMKQMLQEALNYVVFIPFSAGTMTRFEHELYSNKLAPDQFNATWWELAGKYQGIAPPTKRDETWADGLTKTHINDDPAQYYDYALSYALLFQMHDHIARQILKQDPHNTDYYGNKGVGDFLRALMAPGASRDWRDALRETTGRELDAQAMVEYFKPLQTWLMEQNKGRTYTLSG
jgi:peptidyl-dipeptidase A